VVTIGAIAMVDLVLKTIARSERLDSIAFHADSLPGAARVLLGLLAVPAMRITGQGVA
jgi:hypothetical protein